MNEELKFHELAVRKDELQRNVLTAIAENNRVDSRYLEPSFQKPLSDAIL